MCVKLRVLLFSNFVVCLFLLYIRFWWINVFSISNHSRTVSQILCKSYLCFQCERCNSERYGWKWPIQNHNRIQSKARRGCTLSWWRHEMEAFSALLAICAGNSPITGQFPSQVTRSFDVFYDLRLNKRLSKQWWGWWFQTPSHPLWRHCNVGCIYIVAAFSSVNVWDAEFPKMKVLAPIFKLLTMTARLQQCGNIACQNWMHWFYVP